MNLTVAERFSCWVLQVIQKGNFSDVNLSLVGLKVTTLSQVEGVVLLQGAAELLDVCPLQCVNGGMCVYCWIYFPTYHPSWSYSTWSAQLCQAKLVVSVAQRRVGTPCVSKKTCQRDTFPEAQGGIQTCAYRHWMVKAVIILQPSTTPHRTVTRPGLLC